MKPRLPLSSLLATSLLACDSAPPDMNMDTTPKGEVSVAKARVSGTFPLPSRGHFLDLR